ncbi:MAG: hypothetical protein NTX24_00970 [Candidatus Pacearchaeota archaeon]|nr:hypothetical protein [Candidatus Pacearchaeota archaeon]
MPTLIDQEAELFYKIMNQLIYFANSRFNLVNNFPKPEEGTWEEEDIQKITEKIFSKPEIILSFCSENPAMLNKDEIEIAKTWKTFVKDKFMVFTNKDKTIFFSSEKNPKAYEVWGIRNTFFDLLPFEPIMLEAILVPFREKIVYSSSLRLFPISFGGGYKRSLERDFQISKNKFGIISSLIQPIEEKKQSDEDLLRFYLKNKQNREEFWEEINEILKKDGSLKNVYHNEIGKSYVKEVKKIFSDIGIKEGYFAIVNSQVITSGKSENEVKERLKEILPEDKIISAHIFRYQKK